MYGSWFLPARFRFSYFHPLTSFSFEMPKSWSLETSEMEVASVQQSGETMGSRVGLLEWRTGGREGIEKR